MGRGFQKLAAGVFSALLLSGCGSGLCLYGPPCGIDTTLKGSLSFGEIYFNTTTTGTLTLSNVGGRAATDIVYTSNLSSPISYLGGTFPGTGGTCTNTLGPSSSCKIVLQFAAPFPAASFSQSIAITYSNDSGKSFKLSLPVTGHSGNGTFNRTRGFAEPVLTQLSTSQGLYVGGGFVDYSGTSCGGIARFTPNGSLDTSFNTGTGFLGVVNQIVAIPDSTDIYVAGNFTSFNGTAATGVVRLTQAGALNTTFTPVVVAGAVLGWSVNAIATTTDGSDDFYLGGYFNTINGTAASGLARIRPDGSLNTSFVSLGFNNPLNALYVDASGNVYVGGIFGQYNAIPVNRIIRLNSSGARDVTYPSGGGTINDVTSIVPAPGGSGELYLTGNMGSYSGTITGSLVRIFSDGSLDGTFLPIFDAATTSVLPAADGSGDVYVGGEFQNCNFAACPPVVRLKSNATVDPGFNMGAGFPTTFNPTSLGFFSSGLVLGSGYATLGGSPIGGAAFLTTAGALSSFFDGMPGFDGVTLAALPIVGTSDLIVAGDFTSYMGSAVNRIIRLHADGSVDTTFNPGTGADAKIVSLVAATGSTGAFYMGGQLATYRGTTVNGLARLNSDGSVDTTFVYGTGFDGNVDAMALAPDGSGDLYVVGAFNNYQTTNSSPGAIRLHSDGTVAGAFNVGAGFDAEVNALAPAQDGSGDVFFLGQFGNYNTVSAQNMARVGSDGSLNTVFNSQGFDTVPVTLDVAPGTATPYVSGLYVQYGGVNVPSTLIRFLPDGSIDTTFAPTSSGSFLIFAPVFLSPYFASNGDIYAVTIPDSVNLNVADFYVVRLFASGASDSTFPPISFSPFDSFNVSPGMVPAVDGTGDFYLTGDIQACGGKSAGRVARFNTSGTCE